VNSVENEGGATSSRPHPIVNDGMTIARSGEVRF